MNKNTNIISYPIKTRESNIELLRIVAMFMVMILHIILGLEKPSLSQSNHLYVIARQFFEFFAIGSVNTFVLITGWFGLKPSINRLSSFIFQCIFFTWGIFLIMTSLGISEFTFKSFDSNLFVRSWFIQAYLILYILSPALNLVIERGGKKKHLYMLLGLMTMEVIYDFCGNEKIFGCGYSGMHFVILYLLAQYIRKYEIWSVIEKHALLWFCVTVIALTFLRYWLIVHGYSEIQRISNYSSPFIIFTGLCLLLGFRKFRIQNRIINWLASSSFGVYLLHTNPLILVPIYIYNANIIFEKYNGMLYLFAIFGYMTIWFIISVIIDKFRIWAWNYISPKFFKE